jgi:geranylgeranyl pyrophosphate synthase
MEKLGQFFGTVSSALEKALDDRIIAANISSSRLEEAIRWSLFGGGKRFRPALMIAVGQVFGADESKCLRTAAAVELVHTYSLIHDDLPAMDDDELRRGRATCHVQFGEATAILAGDALQALAFEAITGDSGLDDPTKVQLVSELVTATTHMIDGQQLDLSAEGTKADFDTVAAIHRNKTGALICFSARAGALIAGARGDDLRAVTKYSSKLGLLFQITDDMLDATQKTETLGKTAAKDATSGKATYPSIHGIEASRELAIQTHSESIEFLADIDRPTEILREIADFILHRRS